MLHHFDHFDQVQIKEKKYKATFSKNQRNYFNKRFLLLLV